MDSLIKQIVKNKTSWKKRLRRNRVLLPDPPCFRRRKAFCWRGINGISVVRAKRLP